MKFRIKKRRLLVIILSLSQLACLLLGMLFFAQRLKSELTGLMRSKFQANSQHASLQMAELIRQMHIKDMTYGSDDWNRLQSVVENLELSNQGFVCIIDRNDGRLLCHPDMVEDPGLRERYPGKVLLHHTGGERQIMEAGRNGSSSGWAKMVDGTYLIGVADMPELGIAVLAHQPEATIVMTVDRIVLEAMKVGLLVSLLMVSITTVVTVWIVRLYENRVAEINDNLEVLVEQRSQAVLDTRNAIIFGLARLTESRDDDTGEHLDRISVYVSILAEDLAKHHKELDYKTARIWTNTSTLHDIGKVGVPDAILCKPGKLTKEEREEIKKHTLIGGDCLLAVKQKLGEDDFLTAACQIAFSHHEKWDGSGYPFGLKGEGIPLSGRIVALADVYDALRSARSYKSAMSHDQARKIIIEESDGHFDPIVIEAFLRQEKEFAGVADRQFLKEDATVGQG